MNRNFQKWGLDLPSLKAGAGSARLAMFVRLIILHYHLRPGGIRRVVELATPFLAREIKAIDTVVLATGEPATGNWIEPFRRSLMPVSVRPFIEPAFKYLSEQKKTGAQVAERIRNGLERLLAQATPENTIVWAHNLGVGRNLFFSREVARACADRGLKLISHHHDWWFDNRWHRWAEMRRAGFGSLRAAAEAVFPTSQFMRHVTINQSDAAPLKRRMGRRIAWLPNLVEREKAPATSRVREAHKWLCQVVQARMREMKMKVVESTAPQTLRENRNATRSSAFPIWLVPSRFLRRKNIAEALLLTRWLRPEAWLATTGGPSSADEAPYFKQLDSAARRHGWPLCLGVLQGDESRKPTVSELLAASEAVLLTSIQEGFGLPYVEAAAMGRPLLARSLPNIAPDLHKFGFRFPQYYEEILIDPELFDWKAEHAKQAELHRKWRQGLPQAVRKFAGHPILLLSGQPRPIPFSRLTFAAQLQVLQHPAADSWKLCVPLNSFLGTWKKRSASARLQNCRWPGEARRWLSGKAYARHFERVVSMSANGSISGATVLAVQGEFIRERLRTENLYPLMWGT